MDQKNRALFSIAIILLIFIALLVSFGRTIFRTQTPEVVLPNVEAVQPGDSQSPGSPGTEQEQTVSVTPQTVQSVIATLERTDSYYRETLVEQFWVGGFSAVTVQTWADQGWTRSRQQLPSGVWRNDIIGPDSAWYWYDGAVQYQTLPADDRSADLTARHPTYETVLELDPALITTAGYTTYEDEPCIYLCAADEDADLTREYWVSVDSGLLLCAEMRLDGQIIYRMSAVGAMQSPCPAAAVFHLPDGTILHQP